MSVSETNPTIGSVRQFIEEQKSKGKIDTSSEGWKTRLPQFPQVDFTSDVEFRWVLNTGHGDIVVKLLPQAAPQHVANFIYLTELGFFDDLDFHRVIPEFMAQGGCPLGTGTGGPGYKFAGEFNSDEKHDRPGLLSMANAGPRTDGSQFFLTFVHTRWLDGNHTIFGEVVDGMETLRELESRGTPGNGSPTEPLPINSAKIEVC